MTGELKLEPAVAPTCGWCGLQPAVTKLYGTPTCQGCIDGGSQHRVRVALQRWKRSAVGMRDARNREQRGNVVGRGLPMMRRTPLRRSRMRHRFRSTRYSRRPRNLDYMRFVKTLLCSVEEERPDPDHEPTPCSGVIEADHAGKRGISQKADDRTCIPMCAAHHRQRTDHTGSFKHTTRESNRAWLDRAITRTQTLYAERNGDTIA